MRLAGRRLSLHLMAQPGVAWRLLSDDELVDQGLLSRILVVGPTSTMGTRFYRPPDAQAIADLAAYEERLAALLDAAAPLKAGSQNALVPRELPFSGAAQKIGVRFYNAVEHESGNGGRWEPIRGFAGKATEHAARIAGVLTLAKDLSAAEVAPEEIECGIALVEHYFGELMRLRGAASIPQPHLDAIALWEWLEQSWAQPLLYPAPVYQRGPHRMRRKDQALAAIRILEEHGWLHRIEGGARIDGARRRDVWAIYGRGSIAC